VKKGELPVNVVGIGFPRAQGIVPNSSFPEYPTLMDNMVANGQFKNAGYGFYLDPDDGPEGNPTSWPEGIMTVGGVDQSKVDGEFKTFTVLEGLNTSVAEDPLNWIIALATLKFGNHHQGRNLIQSSTDIPCIIDVGTLFNLFPTDVFANLLLHFPNAVQNGSTGFYNIPCDERDNPENNLSFTFADPIDHTYAIKIRMPASELIWPSFILIPEADPNTCVLAAGDFSLFFAGSYIATTYKCVLGDSLMKHAYWYFDLQNKEVSVSQVKRNNGKERVIEIPSGGVTAFQKGIDSYY
jgi:hypothetical protein